MSGAIYAFRARAEARAATRWIANENPIAGAAFVAALQQAAERIGAHPEIGVARLQLAPDPYRFLVLSGFPYLLLYDASRRPPAILRVLHGARDLPRALRDL